MNRSRAVHVVALLFVMTAATAGQQRPPRDIGAAAPAAVLGAIITGRVTEAESGTPLRRVEVVAGRFIQGERTATTDDEGRFTFEDLPPGAWNVRASKTGYTTMQAGQRRPFAPAAPIELRAGARVALNIGLPRAAVITGRIYDEYGDPAAGVRVQVMRARISQHRRYLQPVGEGDLTDDTGAFRIHSLAPGEY